MVDHETHQFNEGSEEVAAIMVELPERAISYTRENNSTDASGVRADAYVGAYDIDKAADATTAQGASANFNTKDQQQSSEEVPNHG